MNFYEVKKDKVTVDNETSLLQKLLKESLKRSVPCSHQSP
jgi:hypothetical protein